MNTFEEILTEEIVTILVLVEMSLQWDYSDFCKQFKTGHNPCFSRNVFAIEIVIDFIKNVSESQSLF